MIAPGIGAPQRGHPPGSPGAEPAMARWDPLIWEVVSDDPQAFALVKSVLRVESAGRQFAVSRTGCAGLMQFCARTARSRDFRKVFGVGRVYPCRCDGPCSVPAAVRRDLESGDKARILAQAPGFVCELNDARFDPRRSIAAGWRYLETLQQRLGGNINLTYIGYNSGPKIAARVFARLESDGKATLKQIGRHLANVLRPVYGAAADRRARSLLRVHLPKLQRAYRNYRTQARRRQLARISHSVRLLSARHRYAVGPPSRTTPAAPSTSWPARPPG